MSALAEIERFLERLFERTSARVFRAPMRPVQLQRRVERAMELARVSGSARTVVPDQYRLRLHPDDLAALGGERDLPSIAAQLADSALAFARAHGFQLLDRPRIALVADPTVEAGSVQVETRFAGGRPSAAGAGERGAPEAHPELPAAGPGPAGSVPPAGHGSDDLEPTRTLVFRRPIVAGPRAVLRVIDRAGRERTIDVDGTILTIGRAGDNGLVVDDGRISRHHARLQARRGALVFTDLGSTNGSRVNGLTVDEIVLGLGDRIELGDTTLVVESLPG